MHKPYVIELGEYQLLDRRHLLRSIYGDLYKKDWPFHTGVANWELRQPGYPANQPWHRDNAGHSAALIVWSNIMPTEIGVAPYSKRAETFPGEPERIIPTKSGVVYLVDNKRCIHRSNLEAVASNSAGRYFMRATLADAHGWPDDELIETWMRELKEHQS